MSATIEHFQWLAGDDVGVSSATLWSVMTGERADRFRGYWADRPHDPDDLGRCIRLLDRFPEWRARLPEVAERHPAWADLVAEWPRIEALYREEIPDGSRYGKAPRTYRLMRDLAARRCCCGAAPLGATVPGFYHKANTCGRTREGGE